jgi:hypothetical protein
MIAIGGRIATIVRIAFMPDYSTNSTTGDRNILEKPFSPFNEFER